MYAYSGWQTPGGRDLCIKQKFNSTELNWFNENIPYHYMPLYEGCFVSATKHFIKRYLIWNRRRKLLSLWFYFALKNHQLRPANSNPFRGTNWSTSTNSYDLRCSKPCIHIFTYAQFPLNIIETKRDERTLTDQLFQKIIIWTNFIRLILPFMKTKKKCSLK